MIRYLTAGESHGPALVGIIDGLPAGIKISQMALDERLKRRQSGYGRGGRMMIETDTAKVLSGVRFGRTLGSPIAILIENADWKNWQDVMDQFGEPKCEPLTKPRPGHADLSGMLKFGHDDARNILERASARETAMRVACGYFAEALLDELGIKILSHVLSIGPIRSKRPQNVSPMDLKAIEDSEVRCLDPEATLAMKSEIDKAARSKDTLGGTFEVLVFGLAPGIGSYTHWDRKLDARIAFAVKSIQAIKGVEFGDGFELANENGSQVHDQIYFDVKQGYHRRSNRAGGFEGGMSNGETLVIRAAMKPIATIPRPLATVDVKTKLPAEAIVERSDVSAVPAAAIIAEACVAIEVADAILEQFGTGNMSAIKDRYLSYQASSRSVDDE